MLFTGEYEHTIDAKQRLAIPAEIRSLLDPDRHGTALFICPGPNGSLWLYPERTFETLTSALEGSLLPDDDMMAYERFFFSQSRRLEIDKAGRVRLPEPMIRRAGLGQQVVILGVNDHLELQDAAAWESRRDQDYEQQRETMLKARQALSRMRSKGEDGSR